MGANRNHPTPNLLDELRREVRANPNDAESRFRLAVTLMRPPDLSWPSKRHKMQARDHLSRALALRANDPAMHALMAFVQLELESPKAAAASLRTALKLDPNNETNQDFLLETLDHMGAGRALQRELAKAAKERHVDLVALRKELRDAEFPTDPSTVRRNAFPAGERHYLSILSDIAEQIERRHAPQSVSDHELAVAARGAIKIDARRVPSEFRPLIALTKQWGIPDDADRSVLIGQASKSEKSELRKGLPIKLRRRINEWLDSFADVTRMPQEAVHFMYLLEAYEEI